ncbi:MAG: hypothetical protein E7197_10515 [Anaerovibrio sp.]|uniref:hypothetical protein n=1 Tax=Anaerovibrio sp. TaxID=1872532 RepID=UPI0025BB6538|nr:hypothetical protein [Anaerovibrio sp.]MBE6100466.1 hypothetical protein [Anaerovibrio sp.]
MNNNHLLFSIVDRLPGHVRFRDMVSSFMFFRYGFYVGICRIFYSTKIYFLGVRSIGAQKIMWEVKTPYPFLYHFTPKMYAENITKKGLLINGGRNTGSGAVYMTDGLNPRLIQWLDTPDNICFRIDLEKLNASGHRVFELNCFHEYITDFVPPDCLEIVNERLF